MVFDAEDGQLIGLDVSAQQQTIQSNIVEADDVLVFPVEQNLKYI
jgi:DNA polymerase-3 subunit gamma/tau